MKREWKAPQIVVEQFMANEYVASCGSGKTYYFVCNASTKFGDVIDLTGYTVYDSTGKYIATYDPCSITHEVDADDTFIDGYIQKNVLGLPVGRKVNVIIWRGEDGDNCHCTTNLNQTSWEVARS